MEQPLRGYIPGEALNLRFTARTNGSAAGGRLQVYDFTARRMLAQFAVRDAQCRRYGAQFVAPAAPGHDVRVRLVHENWSVAGGLLGVDDVTVRRPGPRPRPTPRPVAPVRTR